ncbi:hypothetical protein ACHAWC_005892 [Mediolabrus comicus]
MKMTTTADNIALVPLKFTAACSDGSNPSALENYCEDGEGWVSAKGATFPQTLTLKILNADKNNAPIHSLEILSHESLVPSKVDIDLGIGNATTFEECSISHLGYITFNKSDGQSRELKSIPLGDYIRFTFHGCHEAPQQNPHNQVGICAIQILTQDTKIDDPIATEIDVPLPKKGQKKSINSLPLAIKNDLDPKIAASVDRIERLKKESAANEDFDLAADIKSELGKVYDLLISFKDSQKRMQTAATEEDFVLASRLKVERDNLKSAAITTLAEVEKKFYLIENTPAAAAANLSISTIKDDSFISERPIKPMVHADEDEEEKEGGSYLEQDDESTTTSTSENGSPRSVVSDEHPHPLAGVVGFEDLPAPEEIRADVSTDQVHKIQSLFGYSGSSEYLAKCHFSSSWSLREAALAKMTMLLPEICSAGSMGDDETEVLFSIIETSSADKNVQVYLSGLVLLDEVLRQLEQKGKKLNNNTTPLLSRILVDLLSKLADNSHKVADSAELSLLATAHSTTVDVAYVAQLATKRIRTKGSVRARLEFLQNLSAEFGVDVVEWKKSIDFAKGCKSFDHRDGSVREAAKSLAITLAKIHGDNVFKSLEDINERQMREIKHGFYNSQ